MEIQHDGWRRALFYRTGGLRKEELQLSMVILVDYHLCFPATRSLAREDLALSQLVDSNVEPCPSKVGCPDLVDISLCDYSWMAYYDLPSTPK